MLHTMKELLTTAEVRDRLDVSASAVSQMVARGVLCPAMKLPGKRGAFLFDPSDIQKLEESKK